MTQENTSEDIVTIAIITDEFPKPFSMTKWLVLSSCFFLIPATYALQNAIYLYGFVSVSTTICSINHWRCAEDGLRRKVDKIVAMMAFIIYFSTGCVYFPIYISVVTFATIALSFMISNHLSKNHDPYWVLAHVFFHASVTITKIIIIYHILNNK